jgi:hypothetical protein
MAATRTNSATIRSVHFKMRLNMPQSCLPHPYPVNANFSAMRLRCLRIRRDLM